MKKLMVILLLLALVLGSGTTSLAMEDVCFKAFQRCEVDAVIAGIFSGIQSFVVYSGFCITGYSWCLKYYVEG